MYRLVRYPLALLFGIVLALSSLARADSPSRATLAKAGKAASAFVQAKDGSGSAFCIHPSGLFLTNHHVIERGGDITLVLNANRKDQRMVKAQVLRSDPEANLALLRAEGVKDLPSLPIGSDEMLSEGDDVVACGFPFGKQLALARDEYPAITVTFGKVTALRQKSGELELIQLDVELHPGNSGGPILGNDGKVVGVAVAVVRGTNFRLAVPARKVHRFLEAPIISFRPPEPEPGEWRTPLDFEARAVSFLPTKIPFRAELWLRDMSGKVRKYPMTQVGDAFKATAPLLNDSVDLRMVCCTVVVSQDGKELARLGHWVVRDGDVAKRYLANMPVHEFKKGEWDLSIGYVNFPPWIVSPIRVGGQTSPRGLSTFPNCSVFYRLKKRGLLFRSQVGIDDTGRGNRAGPITFAVFGDGKAALDLQTALCKRGKRGLRS